MNKTVADMHGGLARYKAKFDALISAHYTAAAILHDRTLTLAQFEPARYDDPKLRKAAVEQVEVRPDPSLKGIEAVVKIDQAMNPKLTERCVNARGVLREPAHPARRSRASSAPTPRTCCQTRRSTKSSAPSTTSRTIPRRAS